MPLCAQCLREAPEGALYCPFCRAAIVPPQPKGAPPDPMVGQTIKDAYIVQERIGVGGMGRVYRAVQISLGRSVALKLLRPALESDTTIVQRFHREARACSRLHHPNVIQVLDFGQTEDGALFIVMEYVPGRSLFGLLRDESPLAEPRAIHLAAQILSALAEAHRASIVHRDLKPENVMVESRSDEPEFVKVLDFGIAKLHEPGADDGQLTRTGVLCGTPNYMSPEQASLFPIDARSDLYSVGVILYEMLTGRLPFAAATPSAMAQAHAVEPPPPVSERCPPGHHVSPALEALVMKALEKDPRHRFQTAEEMRHELLACPLAARGEAAPALLHAFPAQAVQPPLTPPSPHVGASIHGAAAGAAPATRATAAGLAPTTPLTLSAPTPGDATPHTPPARSAPLTEELGEIAPWSPTPGPVAPAPAATSAAAAPFASSPGAAPTTAASAHPSPAQASGTRSRARLAIALAVPIAALAAGAVVFTRSRSAPSPAGAAPGEKVAAEAKAAPRPAPPAPAEEAPPSPSEEHPVVVRQSAPGPVPRPSPARERKRDGSASAPGEPRRRAHAAAATAQVAPPEPATSRQRQAQAERRSAEREPGPPAEPRAAPPRTASLTGAASPRHAAAPAPAAPSSPQRSAVTGAAPSATTSAEPAPATSPPPAASVQHASFVTREVTSFQLVFGDPALQDRGRALVGRAHWILDPGGTLTFAPAAAAHGLFPMKVRATRDGSRVTFEGTNTARASDGLAYVRISGLLALGAKDALLTLDMEIGRALGPYGTELDPTYRARTRLRLASE